MPYDLLRVTTCLPESVFQAQGVAFAGKFRSVNLFCLDLAYDGMKYFGLPPGDVVKSG